MPNPSRTWSIAPNNAYSDQTTQATQYRESAYNKKQALVSAGWIVDRSSNGTTASGADNWTSAAALGLGAAGTGAWWAGHSPSGWADASNTVSVLLAVNATGANPQSFQLRMCNGTYSSGTTSTLPTPSGTETSALNYNILNWASVQTGRWTSWYTTRGDVFFGVKQEAVTGWRSFAMILSNSDTSGGGTGNRRCGLYAASDSTNALGQSLLTGTANWRGLDASGATSVPPEFRSSVWPVTTSWNNGQDINGQYVDDTIDFWQGHATLGRWMGQAVDIYAAMPNSAWGTLDNSEAAQTQRRVITGHVWLYMPTASLPFV